MSPSTRSIGWRYLSFDALSNLELYAVLQLRSEVFVVEQTCVFQDMDGADTTAMHLLGMVDGQLLAYARCLTAGEKFAEASIGRVIIHSDLRGTGAGHALMRESIKQMTGSWGPQAIRINAQAQLENFYSQYGFMPVGLPFVEDGIPHIEMLRPA